MVAPYVNKMLAGVAVLSQPPRVAKSWTGFIVVKLSIAVNS